MKIEFDELLLIKNTQRRNSTYNIFQLSIKFELSFERNPVITDETDEIVKSNRRSSLFISDIYCEFRVRDALGKH